jgi:diguanylate cyclase (GGDEF)-like protein
MDSPPRALPRIELVLAGLIAMTITLLVWHHFGMNRVMEFSAASGRNVVVNDDRIQQGTSVATLSRRKDALVMDCDLGAAIQWPYCRIQFLLADGIEGVDLSAFDTVSVDFSYKSPRPHAHPVRLSLRNYEPGLSTPTDYMSQKIIEAQLEVPANGIVEFPVKVLRTAPWWLDTRKVPMLQSDVRIDNVTSIDLAIGSADDPGNHQLVLRALKFHGKLISQNHLLMLLMAVWIVAAMSWLIYTVRHYRAQLRKSTARVALLSQINSALELEANELADQVYTDSLTGALNREGLRDALINKWQPPPGPNNTLAVVFVDVDHFKNVNDTHGHTVGDEVLRAFATAVRSEIRSSDKLVRWGGEEFLIVCPGTGPNEAHALAAKLREVIHFHIWPCGLRLTASFGVTGLQQGEEIGDAIKRADEALYRAKSSGRNCVHMA